MLEAIINSLGDIEHKTETNLVEGITIFPEDTFDGSKTFKAKLSYFKEVCQLFTDAVEDYRLQGINQWQRGYDKSKILLSIIESETYIAKTKEGKIAFTFAISSTLPEYYSASNYSTNTDNNQNQEILDKYLQENKNPDENLIAYDKNAKFWVVRSLCKSRTDKSKFLASKVLNAAIKAAIKNNLDAVYLDCVADNFNLVRYYHYRVGFDIKRVVFHPGYNQKMIVMERKIGK